MIYIKILFLSFSLTHQNTAAYEYEPYPEYLPLLPHTCMSHGYNNHQNYDYHQSTHFSSAYSIPNTSCHPAHSSIDLRNGPFYSPYNASTLSIESLDQSSDDDNKKKEISNASDYLIEKKSSYNNNNNGSELYTIDHLTVAAATTESTTRNIENICNTSKHKEEIVLSKFSNFYIYIRCYPCLMYIVQL